MLKLEKCTLAGNGSWASFLVTVRRSGWEAKVLILQKGVVKNPICPEPVWGHFRYPFTRPGGTFFGNCSRQRKYSEIKRNKVKSSEAE